MNDTAAAFDALAEEFFSVWFRYHPDRALAAGVHGYEHLLPAQSDDELAALGGWLETLIVALEELDFSALDEDRRIDLRLMFGAARVEHQELLERDWRHRDPLRFLPVAGIYRLTLQPPEDVRGNLVSLLEAVPEYLRLAVSHLRSMAELVAPALVDAAVHESELGRCYLRELARSPWLKRNCYGVSEIETLVERACKALAGFGDTLRADIGPRAHAELGCGEEHLRFLFRHRHFMELDTRQVRDTLDTALAASSEALERLCVDRGFPGSAVWRHLTERRVERGERLELCRRESLQLVAFLRQTGLASLPDAKLQLREWSACPHPHGLGIDYVADRERGCGTYFVSADGSAGQGREPLTVLRSRCMDRTWAGSHLLAFAGGEQGWRFPRRLCAGGGLARAWGMYFRERLAELGHFGRDDRLLLALQRRAAVQRAQLDLELHVGNLTTAEAGRRLSAIEGEDPDAVGLVALARHPGDALAGVLGWQALARLRRRMETAEAVGFEERRFHDRLLSRGRIPISLILSAEFGGGFPRASGDAAVDSV